MTIDVTTPDVPSSQGVPVTVDGVAQVKIGSDENSIRTAAIQFLSKTGEEIRHIAHETDFHRILQQIEQLTVRSSAERLADFLLKLTPEDGTSVSLELPWDKALIAARLGSGSSNGGRGIRLH